MIRQRHEDGMIVRRSGREDAKATLVWIHGLGESALSFEALLSEPRLQRFHHAAPDLPGYGKSPWADPPEGLDGHSTRLLRWIAGLPGRIVVVGHSMGGVVGLYLCEHRAPRVSAFVNVEGNVSEDDCAYSGRIAARPVEFLLGGGFERFTDSIHRGGREDRALRGYYVSMRLCDPRALHRNSLELVAASRARDLADRQAALDIPHVYLFGEPRGTGAASRGLLESAGVPCHPVSAAGHWPFLDRPKEFVYRLCAFLNSVVPF